MNKRTLSKVKKYLGEYLPNNVTDIEVEDNCYYLYSECELVMQFYVWEDGEVEIVY